MVSYAVAGTWGPYHEQVYPTAAAPLAPLPPTPPPPPDPTISGIDPSTLAQATYSKSILMFTGGIARIGGNIIFGPYIVNGRGTWATSFGVPANPDGSRAVYEIAFDSKVAWTLAAGYPAESFTWRFKQGRLDQTVDALETAKFPSTANAYRPQMVIFFEDIPLAQFGGKIPYVSAVIGDTTDGADPFDGINIGVALERIANSPWLGYTAATFATSGIVDVVGAILLSDQSWTMIDLVKNLASIYRNLDIVQNDKLRVQDHGAFVSPDLIITPDRILASAPLQWSRAAPNTQPRVLDLITIDPDADYTWVPSEARRSRDPLVVSGAVSKTAITLPIVMDAAIRTAMVHYALYTQEVARRTGSLTVMAYGLELEPGDRLGIAEIGGGFDDEVVKVTRAMYGANHVVQLDLETFMRCALPSAGVAQHITCANGKFTATTSWTFTGVSLGTAAADRKIVLGLELALPSSGETVTAVTIGGVTATQAVQVSHSGAGLLAAVFYAAVPSGTAGDIVVTASGNFSQGSVNVYRVVSAAFALSDTDSAQGTTSSAVGVALDVPANGVAMAGGATRQGASFTWNGADQDCGFVNDTSTQGQRACAIHRATTAETAHAIAIDPSSVDYVALAAASFTI